VTAEEPQPDLRVSVIVPHYNDLAGLELCLAALERQTMPRAAFEIVVADNASPAGPEAVARAIAGRARLVTVAERGAGPARNGGAAVALAPILAFTDSDCIPEPQWLEAGLAALGDHDIVGGRVKVLIDDPARPTPAEAFEAVFAFDNESYVRRRGFTGSGNMFCARALFAAVGGFRSGLSEDVEWSRRAVAKGYSLGYAAAAAVGHPARRTWPELKAKARKLDEELYGLWREKPSGRVVWLARSLALPPSALVHAPRVMNSPVLNGAAKAAALAVLAQVRLWRFGHSLSLLAKPR
jgi:GT2 family glycosyltransferase